VSQPRGPRLAGGAILASGILSSATIRNCSLTLNTAPPESYSPGGAALAADVTAGRLVIQSCALAQVRNCRVGLKDHGRCMEHQDIMGCWSVREHGGGVMEVPFG
jgi:hypothetical protein